MIAIGHTSIMILLAVVVLAAIGVAFTTFIGHRRN
jgi:cell division protein FtsL